MAAMRQSHANTRIRERPAVIWEVDVHSDRAHPGHRRRLTTRTKAPADQGTHT